MTERGDDALRRDRSVKSCRWFARSSFMLRVALAVSFALPLVAAAGPSSISGRYNSNWDEVRLTQDGDRVHGTYVCCGGGTIEGRIIEGRTVRYRWKQPGGEGMGVWTIEGDQLRGTWGWNRDDDDGGRWDLVLSTQIAN
jgi:hypothetical protein